MPTQTFLNLSEEKRTRIFNAIFAELLRVPFPEMSINQIIKTAGIPRGSFYQYFESKDDAFEYFVSESSGRIKACVIKRISTVHGDIFELCETVFDEIIKAASEQNIHEIVKNVLPYVNIGKIEPLSDYIENMSMEEKIAAFSSLGIGNLNFRDEEEIMDLIGVIEAIFQSALPKIIANTQDSEEIRAKFIRRLNLVKKATTKEGI